MVTMSPVIFVPRAISVTATTTGMVANVGWGERVGEVAGAGGGVGSVLFGPAQPTSVRTRADTRAMGSRLTIDTVPISDGVSPAQVASLQRPLMTSPSLAGLP